ncbi:MAG: ribonuclease HII [Flavobacteriales bacterium]|nr:ribonuclease HII [Flavobacteriales bacterium]
MFMLKCYSKKLIVAGCDEAGRGSLVGPVVAASVILPKDFNCNIINDSKLLSEKKRNNAYDIIVNKSISYGIGIIDEKKIDKINILNASILAMHKAISKLEITPELLLIDGNHFKKYKSVQHRCIVKGDKKFISIAAASIIAKVFRDKLMIKLHNEFNDYKWNNNKGYPTKFHRKMIEKLGPSVYHRKSFQLTKKIDK